MWLVACLVAAIAMLIMVPFIVAGIILAISGALTLFIHFLAWLFSPLPRLIGAYNRLTRRIGFSIGRCIRNIARKVTQHGR